MKIIIPIIVLVLLISGLYFLKLNNKEPKTVVNTPTPTLSAAKEETEPYTNEAQGYSLNLPAGFEINESAANETAFVAPGEGPNRGTAWVNTEPSNGRTVEEVVKDTIDELGEGFNIKTNEIRLDDETAIVAEPMPGQDPTRKIFTVHGGILYRLTFSPNDPQSGKAYEQMEEVYKMIITTFRFSR